MFASLIYAFGIISFALAWLANDHYRPWVNFHSEALALLGLGLLLISFAFQRRSMPARAPYAAAWVLLLSILPWLQYAVGLSLFAGDALITSLYLFSFGAAIWLGYGYTVSLPSNMKALTPIFYVLWLVALASAAIGLIQWLVLTDPFTVYVVQADSADSNRAMGNLGQPNQLATLLLIGIACLLWTYEQRHISASGLLCGTLLLTMSLVFTQSRAGMFSALLMAVFLTLKNQHNALRLRRRYILVWLVAFMTAVLLLPVVHDLLLMSSSRGSVRLSDGARSIMWSQVLAGISQSPWFGYGWNQTPAAHAAGSIAFPGSLTFTYAHNIVLDLVAWNGVPIGLLLSAVCVWWFYSRIKAAKDSNSIYAMACLLPIATHSLFEFPFAYSYFLVASGLMVGIVEGSRPEVKTVKLNIQLVFASLALWFVVGTYIVYEYILVEEDFRVVRFENLRLGRTPTGYEMPNIWMLSHMGAMLNAGRQQAVPGMSSAEIENLRKVSQKFPYGAMSFRYTMALALNGQPLAATRQMAIIRGMYGERYYQGAVSVLREQQQEKYPELAKVLTP